MSKEKITILWSNYESSFGNEGWGGFAGWMFGYRREDGLVGSFSEALLPKYEMLFDIIWLIERDKKI